MPIPPIPPGQGGHVPYTHFKYVGTPKRARWQAWVAGPCQWVMGHSKPPSKPCLDRMTCGALLCTRCAKGHEARKMGYQPLYRHSDTKPVVVIVYEEEELFTREFALHQMVTVGREGDDSDSVFLRPVIGQYPKYQTTLFERTRAVDCTDSLLTMWALPEWTAWVKGSYVPVRPTPTPAAAPLFKSDGDEFGPMNAAAARRYAAPPAVESGSLAEAMAPMLDRVKAQEASSNGKHKPKPKG